MSELIKQLQELVGECPHCKRKIEWFNNVPLTAYCWGTEADPHKEWRCIVPERFPRGEDNKTFYQQNNIGKAKYTISFHDGVKKHKDGSAFFDIRIFKNETDLLAFRKKLLEKGYSEKNSLER